MIRSLALVLCLLPAAAPAQQPALTFGPASGGTQRQLQLGDAELGEDSFIARSPVAWIQRQADLAVLAQTPANDIAGAFAALYGADEAAEGADARKLALAVNATNRNAAPVSSVHAVYAEAVRERGPGATDAGDAIALELQAVNRVRGNAVMRINPYDNIRGRTYGLLLGSGGDVYDNVHAADSAVTIAANPAAWNQGIVVKAGALTEQNSALTGRQASWALQMGQNQSISWWHNRGGVSEAAAMTARGGGDWELTAARRIEMRSGAGTGAALTLSEAGLAVTTGQDGPVLQVTDDTLILDPARLPRAAEAVPVGGIWMQEADDGQGILRIRLR
ncbi:hypothetical protein [Jannaschia sp. 2305UL9-9]|uniref:hypothetical protein n=1 Tax=Jannaschia sp. 2305UL9-9 TaxID=3121638 RepID=UPI003528071F